MAAYPDTCVSIDGYDPDRSDGTELMRSEDGTPWLYRAYSKERVTFTIVHPAMTAAEEQDLRDFYALRKNEQVTYTDKRDGKAYLVWMVHPPRLAEMRSGVHADIEMTLTGSLDE